jgi:nicotinamidase-related amidase
VPAFPEVAFREALANALIHRDYTARGAVHVQWRDDALEISSPGGFPRGGAPRTTGRQAGDGRPAMSDPGARMPDMTTALVLVDVQRNMLEGDYPVPAAGEVRPALRALLDAARSAGTVVVHVQNDGPAGEPDYPGTPGWQLVFPAGPGELVVSKDQPDTFAANPDLVKTLRDRGVERLVVAGMQSDYCVQATSRGARGHGFEVVLASGAHATYADGPEQAAAVSAGVERALDAEGVTVLPAPEVRF